MLSFFSLAGWQLASGARKVYRPDSDIRTCTFECLQSFLATSYAAPSLMKRWRQTFAEQLPSQVQGADGCNLGPGGVT